MSKKSVDHIIKTNFNGIKDRIEACGMDGFIFKPFNPDDLLFEIDKALETNRNQN